MAWEYYEVTFCRISGETANSQGQNWNPDGYVPPTIGPGGEIINPGSGSPPQPAGGSGGTPSIVIEDMPGFAVIDLYSIKAFHRFYNPETQNYENNVLEVLIEGIGLRYIRMTSATMKDLLLALNS